jgi:Mg-chelatase subunit ChlD
MKYCKICKTVAKETDTHCAKGHQLSVLGSSAKPAVGAAGGSKTTKSPEPIRTSLAPKTHEPITKPPAPGAQDLITTPLAPQTHDPVRTTLGLGGRLQELEEVKNRNMRRSRGLGLLCVVAALILMIVIYQVYSRTVLAYAVLDNIQLEQDPVVENLIKVNFNVVTPGKVTFDRRSGKIHTEKIDMISKTGPAGYTWSWPSDKATGIDFSVLYRSGLRRNSLDRHFNVTRDRVGVDVVFLMDVTSSMGPFIEGLKQNCIDFADNVGKKGIDCQMGLIGFGDVEFNEPLQVFPPTADVKAFEEHVAQLPLTNGGDAPESGIEALESALQLNFRPHARVCFVHITDADCHGPSKIQSIARHLHDRSIITYVVSERRLKQRYQPLCVNGGTFHSIKEAQFEDILMNVANSIADQIKPQ